VARNIYLKIGERNLAVAMKHRKLRIAWSVACGYDIPFGFPPIVSVSMPLERMTVALIWFVLLVIGKASTATAQIELLEDEGLSFLDWSFILALSPLAFRDRATHQRSSSMRPIYCPSAPIRATH
jgi:hypothetical protein